MNHSQDSSATSSFIDSIATVRVRNAGLRYGQVVALKDVSIELYQGTLAGLIGPDGVGKSSLLSLIAGARVVQDGDVEVFGGDMRDARHRSSISRRIAYMPQGLGKNLYPTLSVVENVEFFGRLFGHSRSERERRIGDLLQSTGLAQFSDRPAGKLSGGMKQKLGLCCALIHDPDILIMDEPTTGVDPLSRREFWKVIDQIRADRPTMSILIATAYMEEAAGFDWLVAMDAGRVLDSGTPQDLRARTGATSMESAFIAILPEEKRRTHRSVIIPPRAEREDSEIAIKAQNLTKRFGNFVAVDGVSFEIRRGEIFGFLGSNGCGKTTTMKVLTGLLPASEGEAWLFGKPVDPHDLETRHRVGYMSQSFSLYSELTVRQNLELHAKLFQLPTREIPARVHEMIERFDLTAVKGVLPNKLPLGQRQRLSLAVAMIHQPEMLILDEPTSGVDPVARDDFWRILVELSRRDRVTIFISTHFMNEAERCDRISLMHAGRVLVSDAPAALIARRGAATLDDAFIQYLEDALAGVGGNLAEATESNFAKNDSAEQDTPAPGLPSANRFDIRRMFCFARREALELRRDPIRGTLAMLGSVILMFVMGYGISLDVEDLTFAVFDRDQTTTSRDYVLNLSGSRYFIEHPPIADYTDLDKRMRSGELNLALEIPPGFARDLAHQRPVQIGVWIDGAMPQRAETVRNYVQGMHSQWLSQTMSPIPWRGTMGGLVNIETRFRYNPDVKSLVAMVPAVIPLLLMLIPAMLTALSVVREKELGSIINFYVTPATRLEFLIGKQLPYIALAMLNFLLLVLLAVTVFGVPFTGSFLTLAVATLLYVASATAIGLLISTFMRSQIAAIFGTAVLTILPAAEFSGIIEPVSSLQGMARIIGELYPTTHFVAISRGTFSKALGGSDLAASFLPLALAAPTLLALSAALLRKQER